jgi:hypothetical protein
MTDNQEIAYILGIQVRLNRENKTLTLSQDKYTSNILTKFNMLTCHSVSTPLETGIRYSRFQSDNLTSEELNLIKNIPYKQNWELPVSSNMYKVGFNFSG